MNIAKMIAEEEVAHYEETMLQLTIQPTITNLHQSQTMDVR